MTTALVGSTGFVGGNLAVQQQFDVLVNSRNGAELEGRHFDTVVFSAAKAEKWRINKDPESDRAHIAELEELLSSFTAERLVLVSTVDVFGVPIGVDEDTEVDTEGLHAYGLHRYRLEQFARERHPGALIVRLPGLFGSGLKKNVIFDLLRDNNVDRIHPDGLFQYYNLAHLSADISTAQDAGLSLVHLTSEPIATREIASTIFGVSLDTPEGAAAGRYDFRTRHAGLFGGEGPYTRSREATLAELREFVGSERAAS